MNVAEQAFRAADLARFAQWLAEQAPHPNATDELVVEYLKAEAGSKAEFIARRAIEESRRSMPTRPVSPTTWRRKRGDVAYLVDGIPPGAAVNVFDLVVGPDGREQYAITVGPIEADELRDDRGPDW